MGSVGSTSVRPQVFSSTRVSTLERNPTSVMCVVKSSVGLHSSSLIREFTQGRNLTSVRYVVRASAGDQILQFITEFMSIISPIKEMVRTKNPHRKKVL